MHTQVPLLSCFDIEREGCQIGEESYPDVPDLEFMREAISGLLFWCHTRKVNSGTAERVNLEADASWGSRVFDHAIFFLRQSIFQLIVT